MKKNFMNQHKRMRKSDDMNYLDFNGEQYLSIKDIYMNLCVSRNSIIKKIERLNRKNIYDLINMIYLNEDGSIKIEFKMK